MIKGFMILFGFEDKPPTYVTVYKVLLAKKILKKSIRPWILSSMYVSTL